MTTLKEWMDQQWRNPGMKFSGHGVAYIGTCLKDMQVRGGSARNPTIDKETKRRRAGLAMYNEKLRPIILAEATSEMRPMLKEISGKTWRDKYTFKEVPMPHYTWPKADKAPAVEQVDTVADTVPAIPRKRIPKAKLEHAARIIAKVPPDDLAAFLAKFGLSLSLAASIASLDNVEQIARQFLRATL
jgi:hypothetical protein